jgi:hypothetical protein
MSTGHRLKKADEDKGTIFWVDEARCYLLLMVVRTWEPRGHTAAAGQIDPGSPLGHQWHHFRRRLFIHVRSASYDAPAMVGFLRVLLRKISGKIVVIYDGAPIQQDTKSRSFSNEEL